MVQLLPCHGRKRSHVPPAILTTSVLLLLLLLAIAIVVVVVEGHSSSTGEQQNASSSNYRRRMEESIMDESERLLQPLFPLEMKDYIGFTAAIVALCLAASSGMGGGGLLIPIYILLLDFPVKHAVPLTSVTVFGGSIANNLLNVRKKHPDHPHRGCVDWDFILMMEPPTIAGAILGAIVNKHLPDLVLVVMLLLLLSFTAYKSFVKANKFYEKESRELNKAAAVAASLSSSASDASSSNCGGGGGERQQLLMKETTKGGEGKHIDYSTTTSSPSDSMTEIADGSSFLADEVVEHRVVPLATEKHKVWVDSSKGDGVGAQSFNSFGPEKQHQVWVDIVKLAGLFVIVTVINMLKGGPGDGGGPFGVHYCGATCFWTAEAVTVVLIVAFVVWSRSELLSRLSSGGPVLSDIHWDERNTILYPVLAVSAGLVAGLFGVGGGLVKGPIMLALDVHPAVASATSASMIFFTSSTTTCCYMVFGLLMYDYSAVCFVLGFFSTWCGQTITSMILQRHQRHSYIAYCIGITVAVSAIAMTVEAVLAMVSYT